MLLLLAPLNAFASDRELKYLSVTGDKDSYRELPSINIPPGGYPENAWVQGTNPLTGEPWTGVYRPVLVNVDTDPLARPNYGVSDADIIYEMPLHRQGNTRSVALFMGSYPVEGAGPVRSARISMVEIAEEWGAGLLFFGMQEADGTSVADYVKGLGKSVNNNTYPYLNQMNGVFNPFNERTRYPNPHNVRANVLGIVNTFASDLPEPQMRPWRFSEEGLNRGASAYSVSMEFRKDAIPSFIFNEMSRTYDRYYNGEPFTDANNNRLCTYANVIVMRTDVSWYRNGPARPVIKMTGQGVAEIFMNGRYIRGAWVRAMSNGGDDGLAARTVFFDENGQEISFLPGKTFIHIVSVDEAVVIGNDPSVGDPLTGGQAVATPKPTKTPKPTRTPRPTRTPKPGIEATPTPEIPEDEDDEVTSPND